MANTTAGLTASWSDIWLLDGVRTPFADYNGALAAVSPTESHQVHVPQSTVETET